VTSEQSAVEARRREAIGWIRLLQQDRLVSAGCTRRVRRVVCGI
jgi:hypothetical protein